MLTKEDPSVNDSQKPDYKINWINPVSFEKGIFKIFTYGKGMDIALAIFQSLYPDYEILIFEKL